jgi:hypothetical protein
MAGVRHDMNNWLALAELLGTTPATVARLVGSVPTRPAEVRRLARKLGVDYESLRTFTDSCCCACGRNSIRSAARRCSWC